MALERTERWRVVKKLLQGGSTEFKKTPLSTKGGDFTGGT